MHHAPSAGFAIFLLACGGQTSSAGTTPRTTADAAAEASAADAAEGIDASAEGGVAETGPVSQPTFYTLLTAGSCLPQALPDGPTGVPCDVFEVIPSGGCETSLGQSAVAPSVAAKVQMAAQATAAQTVCALQQLTSAANPGDFKDGSCAASPDSGWCYVTGSAAGNCPQAIAFTSGQPEAGAVVVLGCQ